MENCNRCTLENMNVKELNELRSLVDEFIDAKSPAVSPFKFESDCCGGLGIVCPGDMLGSSSDRKELVLCLGDHWPSIDMHCTADSIRCEVVPCDKHEVRKGDVILIGTSDYEKDDLEIGDIENYLLVLSSSTGFINVVSLVREADFVVEHQEICLAEVTECFKLQDKEPW